MRPFARRDIPFDLEAAIDCFNNRPIVLDADAEEVGHIAADVFIAFESVTLPIGPVMDRASIESLDPQSEAAH